MPRQFDFTSFLVPSEASKPGMGAGVVLRGATPSSSGARAWRVPQRPSARGLQNLTEVRGDTEGELVLKWTSTRGRIGNL